MTRLTISLLAASVLATSALAQSWSDPKTPRSGAGQAAEAADADRTQALVDELKAMIEQAERDRLADRRLIWDLRDLARRYEVPWRVELFRDDFRDGNYQRSPAWQVDSGRWIVDRSLGLRSTVYPRERKREPTSQSQSTQQDRQQDLAGQVLGALLQQALKGQDSASQQQRREQPAAQKPAERDGPAVIRTAVRISNAFQLRIDMSSWQNAGRLEIALPFAADSRARYALIYRVNKAPGLRLVRNTRDGNSVIATSDGTVTLEDNRLHTIEWTRDHFGEMVVIVDGQEAIRASDRYYNKNFSGLVLVNRGGDYGIREVAIRGTGKR